MLSIEQDAQLRAQASMELRQKEAAKQAGTNYATLIDVKNDFIQRREAVENNWELPEKAKNLRLAQLKTELTEQWHKTKQALEQKAHAELQAAWQKANPAPNVANLTPGQIQARQEVLEDIAAITEAIDGPDPNVTKHAQGEAIIDLYARYTAQGYDIGLDTIAQRGSRYLNADQLNELRQMEEYRKPALAEARRSLEQLRHNQGQEGTAQVLMEGNFLKATQLTGPESEALAQQPKAPPADAVAAWQQMNA